MLDVTTIQVKRTTVQGLELVKKKLGVSSYDKAIRKMTENEIKIPKSLFGAHPEMKEFKRDRNDFHEL